MSQNSLFALNISSAAKKRSDEIKEATEILNKIFSTTICKLESHDCSWDCSFIVVNVNVNIKLPLTMIDIEDFVTTMRAEYHKFLMYKFSEFGFTLGRIYYDGPYLKSFDLYVTELRDKKNEK